MVLYYLIWYYITLCDIIQTNLSISQVCTIKFTVVSSKLFVVTFDYAMFETTITGLFRKKIIFVSVTQHFSIKINEYACFNPLIQNGQKLVRHTLSNLAATASRF